MDRVLNVAENHCSLDATVAAALRDVGFTVQRSRSTQSSRLDRFGSAREVRAEVA
jgi:hypothetical protein